MPSLREVQFAMRRALLDEKSGRGAMEDLLVSAGLRQDQRLDVYRNTILLTLTNALRVSFPAVNRLVGVEFFDAAAQRFIGEQMPRCANLDAYGGGYPDFLQRFEPAASIVYMADVARLEWAVNRALHAADVEALAIGQLAAIDPRDHARVCFVAHPAVSLLRSDYPIDAIWNAVLRQDDAAMAAIDVDSGPVRLIVRRARGRVEIDRVEEGAWQFAATLVEGRTLGMAVENAAGVDVSFCLARHLADECFVGFHIADGAVAPSTPRGSP